MHLIKSKLSFKYAQPNVKKKKYYDVPTCTSTCISHKLETADTNKCRHNESSNVNF